MSRPVPGREAPPGYRFVAVPEDPAHWRASPGGKCRRQCCPGPAVAAVWRPGTLRSSWWRYCAEHLYGRWVEDGAVWGWRLAADAESVDQESVSQLAAKARSEAKERRDLREALEFLVESVRRHLEALDREMKAPSSNERGRRVAALCNALERAKDQVRYGALGIDFRTNAPRETKA